MLRLRTLGRARRLCALDSRREPERWAEKRSGHAPPLGVPARGAR